MFCDFVAKLGGILADCLVGILHRRRLPNPGGGQRQVSSAAAFWRLLTSGFAQAAAARKIELCRLAKAGFASQPQKK